MNQHADIAAPSQEGRGETRWNARRINAWMAWVPFFACAVLAFRYAYDAPYWDEWMYVVPIAKAFSGDLALGDFVVHVNEHIYVVSSLIVISLARLTHWDIRFEIVLILLLYAATFLLLLGALRGPGNVRREAESLWAAPLIALLLFSPSQHAVWNWGLHLSIAVSVLSLVAALRFLSLEHFNLWHLGVSCMLGWMATFSIGGGLSIWPAGTIALLVRPASTPRARIRDAGIWLIAGVAASATYVLAGDKLPESTAQLASRSQDIIYYVLAYLGGPISPYNGHVAAAVGLSLVVLVTILLTRRWRALSDPFLLGLLSIGVTVGLLTALKHAHEGAANAVSSRFLPWPTLTWCAVLCAVFGVFPRFTRAPRVVRIMLCAGSVGILIGWGIGAYKADERYDAFALGRHALLDGTDNPNIQFFHPDPATVAELRPLLIDHRLSLFRSDD